MAKRTPRLFTGELYLPREHKKISSQRKRGESCHLGKSLMKRVPSSTLAAEKEKKGTPPHYLGKKENKPPQLKKEKGDDDEGSPNAKGETRGTMPKKIAEKAVAGEGKTLSLRGE